MPWSLRDRKILHWLLQGFLILSIGVTTPDLWADVDYFELLDLERIEGKVAAPAFSLPDLQGRSVSLENLRDKGVILYFWASW